MEDSKRYISKKDSNYKIKTQLTGERIEHKGGGWRRGSKESRRIDAIIIITVAVVISRGRRHDDHIGG